MADKTSFENPFDLQSMFSSWQKQFSGAMETQQQIPFLQHMVTMNAQAVSFIQQRVNRDVETTGKLMQCKTPMEAAELMQEFYDQAFKDYAKHLQDMSESAMNQGGGSGTKSE